MQVKKVVEREDGSVVFQGILEGPELAFVIETGLDVILQMNANPFLSVQSHDAHDFHETPDQEQ